ncbi:MAG: 2-methylcitrate dehydratase [Rhodobacteraceae bacterium]|nr:MAG: 2-methylcitrate dehydratase [Paracoccaceae bacterium]
MTPLEMIHGLNRADQPPDVQHQSELCVLDLIGIAVGGHGTKLSAIIRDHASETFGGSAPMLFDARRASPAGVALAAGMTIDSLDGHDGFNPAKGHVGASLFPAALALAHQAGASGGDFLTAIVIGYEIGSRTALAQHASVPDYHTSGSWGAVACAAAGARLLGLDAGQTRHALGIAEYHGPRSQMMRCIDHPTMLKDGSGWGAMTGVSAVHLAAKGFTGAPALTVEQVPQFWGDLGQRWLILEQYFKPFPVCRWAQAPAEGVLALARAHDLTSHQVDRIEVTTFHEAVRLATNRPANTEEAQYSTSFPCAVALVRGDITPADIADDALNDPEILRLSQGLVMVESDHANANFPSGRLAKVSLVLRDGTRLDGPYISPRWDHLHPPTEAELRAKYHALADPVLGRARATAIKAALSDLPDTPLATLSTLLFQPIN